MPQVCLDSPFDFLRLDTASNVLILDDLRGEDVCSYSATFLKVSCSASSISVVTLPGWGIIAPICELTQLCTPREPRG